MSLSLQARTVRRLVTVVTVGALTLIGASPASAASAPVGFLDSVTTGVGTVSVSGWATDLDTGAPIAVRVYAGSVFVGSLTADQPRPDVAGVYPGRASTGFSGTLAIGSGTFNICVFAVDPSGAGPNPALGCRTVSVHNAVPYGFVDSVSTASGSVTVSGWALDPDTTAPVDVHAYVDGSFAGATTASASRPDVANAYGLGDRHGYTLTMSIPSGSHRVCLYAINQPTGFNPGFACITASWGNAAPIGSIDAITGADSSLTAVGWALDPDTAASTNVQVSVDGTTVATVAANVDRPDVAAAFGRGAAHGYSVTVNAAPGWHTVCVAAANYPSGSNVVLGCSNVLVGTVVAPTSGTVGVPSGTALTVYNGDLVVTQAGAVVQNLDVRGYVRIQAPNVTVRNTIVRGRPGLTSNTALITNTGDQPGLVITDSELAAADPSPYINGFIGSNVTMTRVNIHGVVDQVHVTGSNVLIDSSWLHDNLHFASDPNQGGQPSHDDNIQVQAGNNVVVRNSVLSGAYNAGVMITQDTGKVTGFVFAGNNADGGGCTVNIAEKNYGPVAATITNNVFGSAQRVDHCAVVAKTTTQSVSSITGNRFLDGTAWKVTRG